MPLLVVLPFVVYGSLLWIQLRRRRTGRAVQRPALAAAGLGLGYLPQFAWERPDLSHFIYHLPVLLVAVVVLGAVVLPPSRGRWAALAPALLCVERQSNRWVIFAGFEIPDSARATVRAGYCRVGRWGHVKLWERCSDERR